MSEVRFTKKGLPSITVSSTDPYRIAGTKTAAKLPRPKQFNVAAAGVQFVGAPLSHDMRKAGPQSVGRTAPVSPSPLKSSDAGKSQIPRTPIAPGKAPGAHTVDPNKTAANSTVLKLAEENRKLQALLADEHARANRLANETAALAKEIAEANRDAQAQAQAGETTTPPAAPASSPNAPQK